ncbi:transglycosylase domain-containing protein [Gaetbulibacter saemankumensis]|uniref:transglycosylase domain-containing protein n=1 Tax=Gaetbulibacter saemankumensis TaxID=311208 RepID=UPI0003FA11D5|nr:transglycosylase domain-containing protein [Gaetbulibacter saemankumensis]
MKLLKSLLKSKWLKRLAIAGIAVVAFFAVIYGSVYLGVFGKIPTIEDLKAIQQAEATQVLDRNGELIGKFYIYDRQPLTYNDFPKHLIDALVATEDVRFFEHDGVDNVSLLRVFIKNIILQDKSAGGGSTITLQLAKNLFGRRKYVMLSMLITKFKEAIIAKRMEEIYSKEDILTLYLNTVPFPDNTYGIESAALKFFNKPASELTYPETATLIGTLKATHYFNPRLYSERSVGRRNVVLQQMLKYNYIREDSLQVYSETPLVLDYTSYSHDMGLAPYFRESVKKQLKTVLDTLKKPDGTSYDLYRDGLVVYTTLDKTMQAMAEAAMKEHLSKLQLQHERAYGASAPWLTDKNMLNAAMKNLSIYKTFKKQGLSDEQIKDSLAVKRQVELFNWSGDTIDNVTVLDSLKHFMKFLNTGMLSVEPSTGAIRSYIGGIDYQFFKYDHVSQSKRQVGSTFKPFVYTAAIEHGMKPCTYFSLSEVTYTNFEDWTPTNSGKEEEVEHLNYNLETALSKSVNTIAVKVLNKVGIPNTIDQVNKLGIETALPKEPSLALGVAEINLKDLTGAYTSYVNESKPVRPYAISKIEDKHGNVIAAFKPEILEPAYSDYTRQIMLKMMQATVNSGTATRLRSSYNLSNAIAGKTGTTQNNKDGWFVGITPKLVTVTWVGNDNHAIGFKNTGIGQGANSALPLFARFYQKLNKDDSFNNITKAHFEDIPDEVLKDLNCDPEKKDGFFKRLFGGSKKKKFRIDD